MRKALTAAVLLSTLIYACTNNKTSNKDLKRTDNIRQKRFFVEKASMYSPKFLDGLKSSQYSDSISLINDIMIVGRDTIKFPESLKINQKYVYEGEKNSNKYLLTVKRTNLTDIEYNFLIKKGDSILKENSGKATLNPMFFLGSESPDDDQDGDAYEAFEYMDENPGHSVWIGIGTDLDYKKRLRAYIKDEGTHKGSIFVPRGLTLRSN
ncbi:MAG: hypothetical protein JST32_12185 [Bacteroidetes bacterium]|nr:hypothetical protein [Bacteroidota bacterium]